MALNKQELFIILKKPQKSQIFFYQIKVESLINFAPIRQKILKNLEVLTEMVEEVDGERKKVIIKTKDFLEI